MEVLERLPGLEDCSKVFIVPLNIYMDVTIAHCYSEKLPVDMHAVVIATIFGKCSEFIRSEVIVGQASMHHCDENSYNLVLTNHYNSTLVNSMLMVACSEEASKPSIVAGNRDLLPAH